MKTFKDYCNNEEVVVTTDESLRSTIQKYKAKKKQAAINPQSKRKRLYVKPEDSPKQISRIWKNKDTRHKENMANLGKPTRKAYNRELKRVAKSIKSVHSRKNPLSDVLGIEDR